MKKDKQKASLSAVNTREIDDTKLVDGLYKLKSYINIIDAFIDLHAENQDFVDLGLLIDNMAEIVAELLEIYDGQS